MMISDSGLYELQLNCDECGESFWMSCEEKTTLREYQNRDVSKEERAKKCPHC